MMLAASRMKKILLGLTAVLLLALAGIIVADWQRDIDHAPSLARAPHTAEQRSRGAYLARAGNCMACHTARGGEDYAGGRIVPTPFGDIVTTNITPDLQTGIGSWREEDFYRALHLGKSRDGHFLYPAFPYPNFTRITRADADDLFAFLRTIKPVRQPNQASSLRFPFNQRWLLPLWRVLYFSPGEPVAASTHSTQWQRGAYLVEGLGHCAACHTARDFLGGTINHHHLTGGLIPMLNWTAPSLVGTANVDEKRQQDTAQLLATGVSTSAAVAGPMAEVVSGSLQYLTRADIDAMVNYLQSLTADTPHQAAPGDQLDDSAKVLLLRGARLYEDHCSSCHQADGSGVAAAYPTLAGKASLTTAIPVNAIRMVLNGGYPPSTTGNPRPYGMPPFASSMTDAEVAAVVSFIRRSWGNQGTLVSPQEVGRWRGVQVN
ncbi:MAG: hypothetical protein RL717_351 [Pseudomonadota bacterium]